MTQTCTTDGCAEVVHAKWMCKLHYDRAYRRRNPQKVAAYNERRRTHQAKASKCECCGSPFLTTHELQRFCSAQCRDLTGKRRYRESRGNDRQDARLLLRALLRQRDGDNCGICGEPISYEVFPHPESASVDHIIPVANGGQKDDPDNVQLVHLLCNTRKGPGGRPPSAS